jgi:hypothetical protein
MPEFDVDMMRRAAVAISAALRELLEEKHLYQSVTVSRDSLVIAQAIIAARSLLPSLQQPCE